MTNPNDIPIHSCTGSPAWAAVHRKTGLYSSEIVCQVISGTLGEVGKANALELASMLCEALEAQREREENR